MAKKLIDQDEAARLLGISVDELNILRDRQEIYGYRDAGSWKYKSDELDRYLQNRKDDSSGDESWMNTSDLDDVPLELNDAADSVLLSEVEMGRSPDTASSTIIGAGRSVGDPADSDIQLAKTDPYKEGGSDVHLVDPTSSLQASTVDSDVLGDAGSKTSFDDLDLGDSGLALGGSGIALGGSGLALGGSGLGLGGSQINVGEGISIEDDATLAGSTARRAVEQTSDPGSGIELASSDDDLVLGGSGSDITLGASDSGISLVDPADSGLSLDRAPLDLGGDSGVELLELGEADVISLDDDADTDAATELKSDEDFLLAPLDGSDSEPSDSGSQVIALDSEDEFSSTGSMFAEDSGSAASMLEEDFGSDSGGLGSPLGGGLGSVAATSAAAAPAVAGPAVQYTTGSVVFLGCTAFMLAISGMLAIDLVRSIWSWNEASSASTVIMDGIVGLFNG